MCAGLGKWTLGFLLLLLLPVSGVCQGYGVEYPQANICAVENSTAFIPCTFFYPGALKVVRVMWGHESSSFFFGPFLFDSNNATSNSRFQYHGDKEHNCSLTIHQVRHKDSGKYAFRFVTNDPIGKFTGLPAATLRVANLSVSPSSVGKTKEGDSFRLTCQSGCDGAQQSFTWLKNGGLLRAGPVLDLTPLSPSDSGNYTCSLSAHPGTTSGVRQVDVEYGPKSTSASLLMAEDGGRKVSLVCSSRANPPVRSYVWFRIKDSDRVVGNQSVLVTGEDGEYFCSAANEHGSQNSSAVTVKIKGNWSYTAFILIAVAMLLIVIVVVVAVRIKKKTKKAPEPEDRQDQNLTSINSDTSRTAKTNQEVKTAETTDVIYTTVHFASSRGQQKEVPAHEVIYSMVHI